VVPGWYLIDTTETLARLESTADGLSADQVQRRRGEFGANELVERRRHGPWQILVEQFREPMVLLLIVAAAVSLMVKEYLDAGAIGAIVILNALLGYFQEYRAEKAMAALREMAVPLVRVRREGGEVDVSATELVPGDVVLLTAGNRVPADCRVLTSFQMQVQEAALTGESQAVTKHADPLQDANLPLGDRTNMIFMGTDVSCGHGLAVVIDTGMRTELGKIADMIQGVRQHRTPLQRRLAKMGIRLAIVALAIVAVVFGLGILRGQDVSLMLMTALSMAVAAVPEGLPAVATIALALGAKRMLRRQALIRKLPAVETLGSVTVICSDKTGTLTENRMRLSVVRHGDFEFDLQQQLGERESVADDDPETIRFFQQHPPIALALLAGALCNDAHLKSKQDQEVVKWEADGDPTEGAFIVAAARFGLLKPQIDESFKRVAEVPFDSDRKRMTTVHRMDTDHQPIHALAALAIESAGNAAGHTYLAILKGAIDAVLDSCTHVLTAEGCQPLDEDQRNRILQCNDQIAAGGKRVLGLAIRWLDSVPEDDSAAAVEKGFAFLALAGLIDPPRREAYEAVQRCKTAGIRPVMITGDHPLTARHIAGKVGIVHDDQSLTGRQLEEMSDDDLDDVVERVSVYARVSPEHKLRIVKALQRKGQIVAMTGDGVNDAPALKVADIGVAMGITGTDVSKDASETVLLDDNFATIVNSVEEGRIIYDNIRKFLQYTMTSNTGEIWVMLAAPFVGMPLPLVPLQILWINLVTDGLPGLAMAVEPGESDTMSRPPREPTEPIFDRTMIRQIFFVGILMGFVSLGAGYLYWFAHPTDAYDSSWGTIVFTVLTLSQMGNALAVRSSRDSLFTIGLFSNVAMLASVALTLALQLAVIYVPLLQRMFRTTALSLTDLAICVLLSTIVFWTVEGEKWWRRRKLVAHDRARE
jgi:Ca2+-transporting ATPase